MKLAKATKLLSSCLDRVKAEKMLDNRRKNKNRSKKASGVSETFGERKQLLMDLLSLADNARADTAEKTKKRKQGR